MSASTSPAVAKPAKRTLRASLQESLRTTAGNLKPKNKAPPPISLEQTEHAHVPVPGGGLRSRPASSKPSALFTRRTSAGQIQNTPSSFASSPVSMSTSGGAPVSRSVAFHPPSLSLGTVSSSNIHLPELPTRMPPTAFVHRTRPSQASVPSPTRGRRSISTTPPASPTGRATSSMYSRNNNSSTTSISSPYRETIRIAASCLIKEMARPSPRLHQGTFNECERRLRSLVRMERLWGKSGSHGYVSNASIPGTGEERERKTFCDALSDGYVLCQLMNKMQPGAISRVDDRISSGRTSTNVPSFLRAAASFGVKETELFHEGDLQACTAESVNRVAETVLVLCSLGASRLHPYGPGKGTFASVSSPNLSGPIPNPHMPTLLSPNTQSKMLREMQKNPRPSNTATSPISRVEIFSPRGQITSEACGATRMSIASTSTVSDTTAAYSSLLDSRSTKFNSIRTTATGTTSVSPPSIITSSPATEDASTGYNIARTADGAATAAGHEHKDTVSNSRRNQWVDPSDLTNRPARKERRSSDIRLDLDRVAEETEDLSIMKRRTLAPLTIGYAQEEFQLNDARCREGYVDLPHHRAMGEASAAALTVSRQPILQEDMLPMVVPLSPVRFPSTTQLRPQSLLPQSSVSHPTTSNVTRRSRRRSEVDAHIRPHPNISDDLAQLNRRRHESLNSPAVRESVSDAGSHDSTLPNTLGATRGETLMIGNDEQAPTLFQLGNCIGKGQFGAVYRALNLSTGEVVAVKRIRLQGQSEAEVTQLMREVNLLKSLAHPSIVRYEGMSRDADTLNIVLEYVENGSLGQMMKAFGRLNEELVAGYVARILEGLHYLHRCEVVHCDLKAANILTTKTGNIKLSDFGVSLNLRAMENIRNDAIGTPNWMAPEIIELKGASPASDIWSLGCTIIELLSGRPPFSEIHNSLSVMYRIVDGGTPDVDTSYSPSLKNFLHLCFQRNPTDRPSAEILFEHEWLKQKSVIHQELRPKESIPFLRRVSAEFERSKVAAQLSFTHLSEIKTIVPTPDTSRGSGSADNPWVPKPQTSSDVDHSFVGTTFSRAVICHVCGQLIERNALLCDVCNLISHNLCAEGPLPPCQGSNRIPFISNQLNTQQSDYRPLTNEGQHNSGPAGASSHPQLTATDIPQSPEDNLARAMGTQGPVKESLQAEQPFTSGHQPHNYKIPNIHSQLDSATLPVSKQTKPVKRTLQRKSGDCIIQ